MGTAYDSRKVVKVAVALGAAGDADIARRDALSCSRSLIVGEEKYLIPLDWATDRTPKLILVEGGPGWIKGRVGPVLSLSCGPRRHTPAAGPA